MLVPDLSRLLREADHSRLTAAVEAAVDAVAWYAPTPKPDDGDTELSIAVSKARAEVAQEVVDAVARMTANPPTRPSRGGTTLTAHWRSVPMPPHVARLPRNSAGRPVPNNTPWYEPDNAGGQMVIRRSAELGEYVVCPCEPGRGIATFGDQCPERQRQLMLQRLCGICAAPIKATSRLVFIGGPNDNFYIEPPVHPRCAAYALQVGPKLAAADNVGLAITRTYSLHERRMTGVSATRTPTYELFPYRDPAARSRGPLDFYLAFPEAAERTPATEWLAHRAPSL